MEPAALSMEPELNNMKFSNPIVPIIQNVDLSVSSSKEGLVDRLVKQICGTVRWRESLLKMGSGFGVEYFFEIGPGKVLAGTVKRTMPGSNVLSVGHTHEIDQALGIIND